MNQRLRGDRNQNGRDDLDELRELARRVLRERGFRSEPGPEARAEAAALAARGAPTDGARDLTALAWSSIDNDDSRDLDQLEVAERRGDVVRVRVAIADVDHFVARDSAIDADARVNTTSLYTPMQVFPMLPRELSEALSSLLPGDPKRAMVTELEVDRAGKVLRSEHYPALVRNHAKLTYDAVSAWLEGQGPAPAGLTGELAAQVRLQDEVAQALRRARFAAGALGLDTGEARAVRDAEGRVVDIVQRRQTRAGAIVEDLMIAVNAATARFLDARGYPTLRRVVRAPERWSRLVALAAEWSYALPEAPNPGALAGFLAHVRAAAPDSFADTALAVVKLVGRGEYAAQRAGETPPGHFGLAVPDYAHSTAPNRRYPDVVTQRLLKAACAGAPAPYTFAELDAVGRRCSEQAVNAQKVERQLQKSVGAMLLASREGQRFDAVVTGASDKGTWVRIARPVVEGRLVRGERGLDVGARVKVQLVRTDVERGHIDFVRA